VNIGLKTSAKVDDKTKTCFGVISGVTLELDVDDIRLETPCKMAIHLHKQYKGKRSQRATTNSVLFIYEQDVLSDHVTIGYTCYHVQ